MTKEELEKEAEEYANNLLFVFETDVVQRIVRERVRLALIDVLEPREKRIAELKKENDIFKKANEIIAQQRDDRDADISKLENRIEELEAQIEKMKCCGNCRWEQPSSFCDDCKRLEGQIFADTLTSDNWEIKEND